MTNFAVNKNAVIFSALLFATALGLLFWPTPVRSVSALTIPSTSSVDARLSVDERIFSMLDFQKLPTIKAPEPAPIIVDPKAPIQKLTLLGITRNENNTIALISDGGRQFTLRKGDHFEGFSVTTIDARTINFVKDDISAALTLP